MYDAGVKRNPDKMTLPVAGMLAGMIFGILLGISTVYYFQVEALLDQVCIVGISLLAFQLFGGTMGSTIGKY